MKKLIIIFAAMSALSQNSASTFGSTYGTYTGGNGQPVARVSYLSSGKGSGAAFLDSSLIFYMKLDSYLVIGTSQFPSTFLDLSGNGYSGVYGGSLSGQSGNPYTGKASKAAPYFNKGNPNSIVVSPNLALTNSFTVTAWVKPGTLAASSYTRIVDANYKTGFLLTTNNNATQYAFIVADGTGTLAAATCPAATSSVSSGTWQFLSATYSYISSVSGTAKFYINGAQSGSTCTLVTAAAPAPGPLALGYCAVSGQGCAANVNVFDGQIGSVRIYNRVLSVAEISAIYAAENI